MQGCEAGTSPFVCTFRAYVAGPVQTGVQNVHVTSFLCCSEESLQEECTRWFHDL